MYTDFHEFEFSNALTLVETDFSIRYLLIERYHL